MKATEPGGGAIRVGLNQRRRRGDTRARAGGSQARGGGRGGSNAKAAAADSRGGEANVARGCPSVGGAKAECLDRGSTVPRLRTLASWPKQQQQQQQQQQQRASDQASRKGPWLGASSACLVSVPPEQRLNFGFRTQKGHALTFCFSPKHSVSVSPSASPSPSPSPNSLSDCCKLRPPSLVRFATSRRKSPPVTSSLLLIAPHLTQTQESCMHVAHTQTTMYTRTCAGKEDSL
ncbi:hypothetical protein L1887_62051 [Cichorium endivia]|nr:hypothetical protein L1887_62051 [Cichorium endivia]